MPALLTFTRFSGMIATSLMLAFSPAAFAEESTVAPVNSEQKIDLLGIQKDDHVLGNPEATVKIIEYASLTCPHCMAYHLETFPLVKEHYIDTGKVAFIYRNFPFNDPALRGAMLAECSGDEQFYKYINVLMKAQDKWAFDNNYMGSLRSIAKIGGMGEEEFDACMNNKQIQDRLVENLTLANQQLNITSTPTTFINGEKLNGFQTFDQLKERIDPLLNDSAKKSAE